MKKLLESYDEIFIAEEEDFYLTCTMSGIDLLSIVDGSRKIIHSHGMCDECGYNFAIEHLRLNSDSHMRWPVVYKGYYCKECYNSSTEG